MHFEEIPLIYIGFCEIVEGASLRDIFNINPFFLELWKVPLQETPST